MAQKKRTLVTKPTETDVHITKDFAFVFSGVSIILHAPASLLRNSEN